MVIYELHCESLCITSEYIIIVELLQGLMLVLSLKIGVFLAHVVRRILSNLLKQYFYLNVVQKY